MRIIFFIFFFLSAVSCLKAQDKKLKYSYRHFGTENGLTQNSVSDALFDKNGYLWISIRTDNVFVYDGYRFTPCWFYENEKKFAFKSASLFCNSEGDIFIAHEKGIHVRKQNTGVFEHANKQIISRENEEITFIGEDNKGKIYFYRWRVGILYGLKQAGGNSYSIDSILSTGSGDIYFDQSTDGAAKKSFFWFSKSTDPAYYLFDITEGKVIQKISSPANSSAVALLAVDSTLYKVGKDLSLYKSNGGSWENITGRRKIFQTKSSWQSISFSNRKNNEVYINPGQHVYKINKDFTGIPAEITAETGKPVLSKGGITKILQKDDNYLWVFTTADGIYQLDIKPKKFEHFHTDDGAQNFIRSVCKDESTGNIFAGLFYGGVLVYNPEGRMIKNIQIPGIGKEEWGRFCVNGISRLDDYHYLLWYNAGRAYVMKTKDWSVKSIINSGPAWEENNKKFVIDYAGFLSLGNNRFASGYRNMICFFEASAQGITMRDSIVSPVRRPEGFYYSAPYFFYGGIGAFYRYHTQSKKIDSISLPFTTKVKWISRDKYNRLWVSTETGIAVLENDKVIRTLSAEDGLPNHYVYVAEPDNKGKMWCSSNKGIFSIDINNYSVTGYNTVDGLQSEEFNTGAFSSDQSGNFYFGGINGFNFFSPESIKENDESNAVHISFIGSGGSPLYQYPGKLLPASIKLSYKNPSLLLRFSALNFKTQGFNQYEYKLHSSDSNWVDNGNNSELQLLLSPGTYHIQVRLKNLPLSATQLKVYIPPPFYQTIWFFVLVIIGIAGIVALVVNRHNKNKYRKKIALLETQQKIQAEKERIAKDLHDNLGVQANAILHTSNSLNDEKTNIKNAVTDLQDTAKEMLHNLRETLWAMKTADVPAKELWFRIISFMKQMGRHYPAITFHIQGETPKDFIIPSNKALNIVLVVQETVNNSVKHAGATIITASGFQKENEWIISIADNGKGFDMNIAKEKTDSYGLQNMQERAKSGNFKYHIESVPGKGTTAEISIAG